MTRPLSRRGTATATFARELLRRWPSLLFMVGLPTAFFAVSYATSDGAVTVPARSVVATADASAFVADRHVEALYLTVLGISVSASFAALAAVRGSAGLARRLRICGYRAHELLAGRVAVLAVVTAAAAMFFLAVLAPLVPLARPALVAAATVEVGLTGVALGALLGSVFTREFEAAMLAVAAGGLQVAVGRSGADAERWMLYTPAVDAMKAAAFGGARPAAALARGFVYVAVLLGLALIAWARATRVAPGGRSA
ncbi:MAG TPA: hypothetical protein VNA14_11840 [Mycobacteriales bacterium]|nr:hypothetical protein [Mycobacteriales bacterium]